MAIHPPITLFFSLKIDRLDGIDDTIVLILELESPITLQYIVFALLTIFLGGGCLQIFLNVGT